MLLLSKYRFQGLAARESSSLGDPEFLDCLARPLPEIFSWGDPWLCPSPRGAHTGWIPQHLSKDKYAQ